MLRRGAVAVAAALALLAPASAPAKHAPALDTAAKRAPRLRPVCHRGERPSGKRHCVRAPKGAKRPRGHGEQGGPNNIVPLPSSGGLGASGFDREESAIAWAEGLRHDTHYSWWCERFVENAFNVSDRFASAAEAARKLGLHKGRKPPRGALVFFRPDEANARLGHVGIALGKHRMISATDSVEEQDLNQEYWAERYMGWAYAPDDWVGRLIIPTAPDPGLQQPGANGQTPQQPPSGAPDATPAVQLTGPAKDQTLGGTVIFTAHTENASGVAFDAYYADDPANVNTLGWHRLGEGNPTGDGNWSMPYDTHSIPDQGNAGWGTVNVMAIAENEAGELTPARDFHRVSIANASSTPSPTPPPPPPPPPAFYVHHVVGTCGEGACGLKKRAGPGYSSYGQVGVVYDGQEIDIVCQTTGQAVTGRNATTTVWDQLTDGSYVTDYYTDTPVTGGFSPPIPHC